MTGTRRVQVPRLELISGDRFVLRGFPKPGHAIAPATEVFNMAYRSYILTSI
jgi:hypothetical protein